MDAINSCLHRTKYLSQIRDALFMKNMNFHQKRNKILLTYANAILSNQNAVIHNYEIKSDVAQAKKNNEQSVTFVLKINITFLEFIFKCICLKL